MKKRIILYILLASGIAAHSQAFNATYGYDANGNRISASVIWLQTSLKSNVLDSADIQALASLNDSIHNKGYSKPNIDSLSSIRITVYPNPTHGMLLVQLDETIETHSHASALNGNEINNNETHNYVSLQTASISVYSSTGQQVFNLSPLARTNTINLQLQPAGTYILTIQLGSLSKTYTIIKN